MDYRLWRIVYPWSRQPRDFTSTRPSVPLLLVGMKKPPKRPVLLAPLLLRQVVKLGFLAQLLVVAQVRCAEFAPLDGGLHGAARLAAMGAVGVAALGSQGVDVGKGVGDAFASRHQAQLAHARHVDQQAAVRQHDELAAGGGVAPVARVADFPRGQRLAAEQAVDERGLAHAG